MNPIVSDAWKLDTSMLLPENWKGGDAYVFNPTMCKVDGGYAICYRVVQINSDARRLATCLLDDEMRPVPGSAVALSDLIEFSREGDLDSRALTWHADPRYFLIGGDIYLSWNDGAAQPHNHQFMLKMDTQGVRPAGPAREIVTKHNRRAVEKNWMFFEADDKVWCIYSSFPHTVFSVDMGDADYVICAPAFINSGVSDYEQLYGVVRGGAQPIKLDDEHLLVLAHSSYKMSDGLRYYACMAYEILSRPPFNITRCGVVPFSLPSLSEGADFGFAKLNPTVGGVVYPCGIVREGESVLISYGINDERAAVARLPISAITDLLRPIREASATILNDVTLNPESAPQRINYRPKLFWWDAIGKSFDGNYGKRKFAIGNFGDIASRDIIERLTNVTTRRWVGDGVKLLGVGSILHNARNNDVIWGSGVKGTSRALLDSVQELDVRACRGPLTADVLRAHKIDMSKVTHVFDPGCLVSRLYEDEIAAYDVARNTDRGSIRIVPHYRDDIFFRRMYPNFIKSFISVDDTPQGMIEKMIGADAVFSSSLHGIIFAESLGIPAYWLKPSAGEDTLKYFDYYYGTGRYNVRPYESIADAMQHEALPLPTFDYDAYMATFPYDRLEDLTDNGLSHADSFALGALRPADIDEFAEIVWSDVLLKGDGMIVNSAKTSFRFLLSGRANEDGFLSLTFVRTKGSLRRKVTVEVKVMGEAMATLSWEVGETAEQTIEVFVPAGFSGRYLDVACSSGRATEVTLKSVSFSSAALQDWRNVIMCPEAERVAQRLRREDKTWSIVEDGDSEWRIKLPVLAETNSIRKDGRGNYVRFLSQAEFPVPTEVINGSRMIFLTGPSISSEAALKQLAVFVDGKRLPLRFTSAGDAKAWKLYCDLSEVSESQGRLARVCFKFQEAEGGLETLSILVRKISFSKQIT